MTIVINEGNVTDGVLRKTLEAHCRRCGQAALGLVGYYPMAAQELRAMGWVTRQGLWVCQHCAPDTPRGCKFQNLTAPIGEAA